MNNIIKTAVAGQIDQLPAIDFSEFNQLVDQLQGELGDLPVVTDTKSRQMVTTQISKFVGLRSAIEKKRKELKSESLEWGRKLDGAAKEATAAVKAVEQQLIDLRQPYDDKKAAEAKEEAKEEARIAQEKVEAEAEAQRQAEEKRLQEIADEEARQATERKKLEDGVAALEAEKKAIQDEKDRIVFEAKAKSEAEAKAKKDFEDRLERERLQKEADDTEVLRQEAIRPDKDKLLAFADALEAIEKPVLGDPDMQQILASSKMQIGNVAFNIRTKIEQQGAA